MKVAVTGAAGHLGSSIILELAQRKIPTKILLRDEEKFVSNNLALDIVKGDLLHSGVLDLLMQGCDTVIHCAAVISVNGDPTGIVYQTNVVGTQLTINAALKSGIKRFVHISSIHAYNQLPSLQILDEQREPVGKKGYAYDKSKQVGKQIALAANGNQMEVIVIHPTSIIGPYDYKPSLMGKVMIDLYNGRLPFILNGGFDFCDSRDVAKAIVNATTIGKAGESYLLSGKWYSLTQLAQFLSKASSKKINPIVLPAFAVRLGLPIIKLIALLKNKEPLYTIEALDALFNGNRCISNAKACEGLKYTTRPFQETVLDTYNWYRNNGYLV